MLPTSWACSQVVYWRSSEYFKIAEACPISWHRTPSTRCNVGQNRAANIFIFKVFFIRLIFIYIGVIRFMLYCMFLTSFLWLVTQTGLFCRGLFGADTDCKSLDSWHLIPNTLTLHAAITHVYCNRRAILDCMQALSQVQCLSYFCCLFVHLDMFSGVTFPLNGVLQL